MGAADVAHSAPIAATAVSATAPDVRAALIEDILRTASSSAAAIAQVEGAPKIGVSFFGVFEFAEAGARVGVVDAQDPEGGSLTYTLLDKGNDDLNGNGQRPFRIVPDTGEIVVNDGSDIDLFLLPISLFVLNVEVRDPGGLTAHAPQIVDVVPALPKLTVSSATGEEGSDLTFSVSLDRPSPAPFDVTVRLINDSALGGAAPLEAPTDYENTNVTLSFSGTGGEEHQLTVATNDDLIREPTETFRVQVEASELLIDDSGSGTGTITDNDSAALTIDDVTEVEGKALVFTVTLDHAVQAPFDLDVLRVDGTATGGSPLVAPADYDNQSQTIQFAGTAGESHEVTVPTLVDTLPEGNETFTVELESSSELVDASDSGQGTIADNTPPEIANLQLTVPENPSIGAVIGSLTATDAEGRSLTFSLLQNANPNRSPINAVRLNPVNGDIIVTDPRDFDFELTDRLEIYVRATENGSEGPGLSSDAMVEMIVTDVNDPPTISPIADIRTGASSIEVTVQGFDPDLGQTFETDSRFAIVSFDTDGLTALQQAVFEARLAIDNGTFYFNLFGGQEKWLRSGVTGNWFYILPNGRIVEWAGTRGVLTGTALGTLDQAAYADPSIITGERLAGPLENPQNVPVPPGSATGVFNGNVLTIDSFDFFGTVEITVRATDIGGAGLSDEASFAVEFQQINEPPVLEPIPDQVSPDGGLEIVVPLEATDPDGDTNLRFDARVLGPVRALTAIDENGVLTITRQGRFFGAFDVLVGVIDGQGGRSEQTFQVRFVPAPAGSRALFSNVLTTPLSVAEVLRDDPAVEQDRNDPLWSSVDFFESNASGANHDGQEPRGDRHWSDEVRQELFSLDQADLMADLISTEMMRAF